jgi:Cu/Ag efflux pump CusA
MANFAHVVNGVVTNLIIADSLEVANAVIDNGTCIEYTNPRSVGIKWSYDGSTFTAPALESPAVPTE